MKRKAISVRFVCFILIALSTLFTLYGCGESAGTPSEENGAPLPKTESPLEGGGAAPSENVGVVSPPTPEQGEKPSVETPPKEEKPQTVDPPKVDPPKVDPPKAEQDTLLKVEASTLNVRAGAGASEKILGRNEKGDMLGFTELKNGWYKVPYKNGYGYVSASYVSKKVFDKSSASVEKVIEAGKKLLGTPYVYGAQRYHFGNGVLNKAFKVSEFDCSSLMQYIFKIGANVNLDTTSRSQSVQGRAVERAAIRRGDLLFFTNDSRVGNKGLERIGHVALYLGEGYILHTASDYAVIEQISAKRQSYFVCARRVL